MKIAIVGAGNAGCITALHYSYYSRSKFEIDIYHNSTENPIERVGQGTVIGPSGLISMAIGFDWDNKEQVFEKVKEEFTELHEEVSSLSHSNPSIEKEFGDVLFSIANVARKLGVDPEEALRHTNTKFEFRFRYMEQSLRASGMPIEQATLSEMEQLWQQAKSKG